MVARRVDGGGMARAVLDRAVVASRVARGAELLIGRGVKSGVGEGIGLTGAELELVSLWPPLSKALLRRSVTVSAGS